MIAAQPIWDRYDNGETQGWVYKPLEIAKYAAENPTHDFAQAAPDVMSDQPRETLLYRYLFAALRKLHGDSYRWKPQFQKNGTCVGQGGKLSEDAVAAIASILFKTEFKGRFAVAATYAGSRVEAGGRPGRWEGSTGAWLAKFMTGWGALPLSTLNLADDARDEDERLAMNWTASSEGIPAQYETAAKEFPIGFASLCRNFDEAARALTNGNIIFNCSNLIPTGKRDSRGFSPVRRSGGHCTVFWGVRLNPNGLLYQNSWDTWSSGGVYPDDQPPGSVWITEDEANAILGQGDSYIVGDLRGLKPLDRSLLI